MKNQVKQIVIVTSAQPSANPRMVKEAITLSNNCYKVKVIYAPLSPWADELDKKLFEEHKNIDWIKVGIHSTKQKKIYALIKLRLKVNKYLFKTFGDKKNLPTKAFVLFAQELKKEAVKHKADLYIGHNIGALHAVTNAAKKNNAKASFDFEDFHRGENIENSWHWNTVKTIEDKYVKYLCFATTASPLITDKYKQLYPNLSIATINNCFSKKYALSPIPFSSNKPLKLFWFSQTVGKNRGIEETIKALGLLPYKNIQLSILGNCNTATKNYFFHLAKEHKVSQHQMVFLSTTSLENIFSIANEHDIGLAVETETTLNRDICLTNKIFVYMLSGICIIATNTLAQKKILSENIGIGKYYAKQNFKQLSDIILHYYQNPDQLNESKLSAYNCGLEKENWEIEEQKLLQFLKDNF